jgi:hypothetical protein
MEGLPSQTAQGWHYPEELNRSVPRPVRLTGGGILLCLVSVFLIVAAGDGSLWFVQEHRRQASEIRRMFEEGRETEGVVTRLWQSHGKGPRYHVLYRYSANGVEYDARPTDVEEQHWTSLQVGGPIAVRYLPSDPGNNILSADPPRTLPLWFPIIMFPVFCGTSAFLILVILRARRYLAYGQPAPACVTRVSGRPGAETTVGYEFPLGEGRTGHGRYSVQSHPPPEGSVVCVLYDPGNPSHNISYPIPLVKLVAN